MRASLKKSTSLSLAALACAALLSVAPFDGAMARGNGGGSGVGSGAGSGHGTGSGGPSVQAFFADPGLPVVGPRRVVHFRRLPHRQHSCAIPADQDGSWGEDRSESLSTCVESWSEM